MNAKENVDIYFMKILLRIAKHSLRNDFYPDVSIVTINDKFILGLAIRRSNSKGIERSAITAGLFIPHSIKT